MNRQAPTVRGPATYQDVLDAPANMVAELVGGTLHLQPRPAPRHAQASFMLAGKLGNPFGGEGGPGGWLFAVEPELHFDDDVVVPDLAGWRREQMGEFPDAPAIEVAPDWVCEILSPGTRRFDLTEKRALYGAQRVAHLWFVDRSARTLEAFALSDGAWVLLGAVGEAGRSGCRRSTRSASRCRRSGLNLGCDRVNG
jgi:Uma2 family endonuclease